VAEFVTLDCRKCEVSGTKKCDKKKKIQMKIFTRIYKMD